MSVKDGVQSAWDEVKDDAKTEVDWMLCGYVTKKEIDVIGKGAGGRKACLAQIVSDKDIVFGGFRVTAIDARENVTSLRTKLVFFFYQAPKASMMDRAKSGSHKTTVEHVMHGSHIQMQIGALGALEPRSCASSAARAARTSRPASTSARATSARAPGRAEAEEAPAVNARDAAPDCVKALTPEQEAAAREKQYQTPIGMPGGDGPGQAAGAAAAGAHAPVAAAAPPRPRPRRRRARPRATARCCS